MPALQFSAVGGIERKTILECPPTVSEIPARFLQVTIPPRQPIAVPRARRRQPTAARAAALAGVLVLSALVGTYHSGEQGNGVGVALTRSPPNSAVLKVTGEASQVPVSPRAEQRMSDRHPPTAGNAYQGQAIAPGSATPLLQSPIQVVERRDLKLAAPAAVPAHRSEASPQVSPAAERSPPLAGGSLLRAGTAAKTVALPSAATLSPAAKATAAKATAARATVAKRLSPRRLLPKRVLRRRPPPGRRPWQPAVKWPERPRAGSSSHRSRPRGAARLDLPDILKPR